MALEELVQDPIHIDSKSSQRVTNCGYCNVALPLPHTLRVFTVEGSKLNLHFHGHMCAFKYEYERRNVPPRD